MTIFYFVASLLLDLQSSLIIPRSARSDFELFDLIIQTGSKSISLSLRLLLKQQSIPDSVC